MTSTRFDITQNVRQMQIIASALMMGLLMFTVIAVFVIPPDQPRGPMVAYIMAGMVLMEIPAFVIIPKAMMSARQKEPKGFDTTSEVQSYQSVMLVRYALCEGAGFANIVAYLIERHWWSLGITGVLGLIMLSMFPTQTRLEHWLETRRFEAEQQV